MKTLEIDQATAPLADYAREAGKNPVILTQHGKPVAALISLEGVDAETLSLASNDDFITLIGRSRLRHKTEGGISSEEMRRRLGNN